jgi:YD repeat-containing protein
VAVPSEPGEWSYAYTWAYAFSSLSYDTAVTAPDSSVTTYHYDYVPATVPVSPGAGPVLLSRTHEASTNGADVEREQRVYTYLPDYGGISSSPHLQQVTITRDGRNYVTTHSYHSTNYVDFHRPWKTEETGELQRTTTRAFDDTLTPLFGNGQPSFVPPLRSETVEVGGQAATRTWERDPTTGFVTRETTHGLSTTFTSDGRGNVASATLGDNTQTSYTYAWGVLKDTVTAAYRVTRAINLDGTVASETRGGRTTSFEYDALSRITKTTPPGSPSHEITRAYPNGTQVRVTRGAAETTSTLDGFGRPVEVSGPASTVRLTYDVFGRKTSETLPFTPNGTVPTITYEYDDLGRLRACYEVPPAAAAMACGSMRQTNAR